MVTVGVLLAVIFRARTWAARRRYAANYVALVLIAVAVFVPLGRFMIDSPNLFWMRTAGRLFGDDVITETDPVTQQLVERDATVQDRINAFAANLPVLGNNVRNALLMFNWKGDVAWINGAPNEPAMDWISGALLVLGLAAWGIHLFRRGDVVDWLVLPAIFIMLLPSALSIAFPVENPSATRTSGSLPLAYFVAAYGLAWLLLRFERTFQERGARAVSVAFCGLLVLGAYGANSSRYFGEYVEPLHDRRPAVFPGGTHPARLRRERGQLWQCLHGGLSLLVRSPRDWHRGRAHRLAQWPDYAGQPGPENPGQRRDALRVRSQPGGVVHL